MDLIGSFERAIQLLRSNLILFLPPLVLFYLISAALGLAGLYIFAPVLVVAANSPAPLAILFPGLVAAFLVMLVLALVGYSYVLAGWSEMNRKVILTGRTRFDDFWYGAKIYFGRIMVTIIILTVIYLVLVGLGIIATFAVLFPLIMGFVATATFGVRPDVRAIFAAIGNTIGLWLLVVTIDGVVFVFTFFWLQAAVLEQTGTLGALRRSISFVKNNFRTTLGAIGFYIIATSFTGAIFPGGGGGGGGGGLGTGFSFTMVIPPPLEAVFRLLIATFFMLFLFLVYADKTGKLARRTIGRR